MTETKAKSIRMQPRFRGIFRDNGRFEKRISLASPTMHDEEKNFAEKAWRTGFSGENITELEQEIAKYIGTETALALSSGTAAVHMAVKLAAKQLYGSPAEMHAVKQLYTGPAEAHATKQLYTGSAGTPVSKQLYTGFAGMPMPGKSGRGGSLRGKRVFCSDFTSSAMVNPVVYEGGEPVFIDCSEEDWCMDPEVLEIAFKIYPDVRLVIMNHAYGFPGQIQKIQKICREHGAMLIEDASESLGAKVWAGGSSKSQEDRWRQTGTFGDYGILDFAADKILTGSGGGILLINDQYGKSEVQEWASEMQSTALKDQQAETGHQGDLGYRYGISDISAGIILGQRRHLDEHIKKKKAIYERYHKRLDGGLIGLNPAGVGTEPNYWQSCMTCESNIQFREIRSERSYTYTDQHGTAAPMEICDALDAFGAEARPVYKPMSMQPLFKNHDQITLDGSRRTCGQFRDDSFWVRSDVSRQNFDNGLCLPCDIKMTEEEQDRVIEIVLACFNRIGMDRMMWV